MKTVTLADAIAALERRIGFRRGRLVAVSQRLQQAGIIPTGAPRTAPQLTLADVVALVIAYAADAPIHLSARSVETYVALTPEGADVAKAPAGYCKTAGEELLAIAEMYDDADLRRFRFEFVSSWPEVAIHLDGAGIHRFLKLGALPGHWQSSGHRKSIVISGAAFADVIGELFT